MLHSTSATMNHLALLLGLVAVSVLGLPMQDLKYLADGAGLTHGTGGVASGERTTADLLHGATTSAGPQSSHGGASPSLFDSPSQASPLTKPVTKAQVPPVKPVEPTSVHPSVDGVPVKEIPQKAGARLYDLLSRFFNKVFGRTTSIEKSKGSSENFLSRLLQRFRPSKETSPLEAAQWTTLTAHSEEGPIQKATFKQLQLNTIDKLIAKDKDLQALWASDRVDQPFEKRFELLSKAYAKLLDTPPKKLTLEKGTAWIQALSVEMSLRTEKHAIPQFEAWAQFWLLDMRAKLAPLSRLNDPDARELHQMAQSLQNFLKTRFLASKTEQDLLEVNKVPWAHELFYSDSKIYLADQGLQVQKYFEGVIKASETSTPKRITNYILEDLTRTSKPSKEKQIYSTLISLREKIRNEAEIEDPKPELEKLTGWINKNNPEISSQQKTALVLLLADLGLSQFSTFCGKIVPHNQSIIQSMLYNMFRDRQLMTHNMQRLVRLNPILNQLVPNPNFVRAHG